MSSSSIIDQVRQIAADLFGEPLANINADTSPQTLPSWDSIQHLNLMLALEETFGIQIEPHEAEEMHSIGETAAMIEQKVS